MINKIERLIYKVIQLISGNAPSNGATEEEKKNDGLPESLNLKTLKNVCSEVLNDSIQNTIYSHLSGWKSAGAFRVFINTKKHENWTLIYKNAVYGNEHTPALQGLPLRPGYPEYLICQYSNSPLKKYLPKVYHHVELIPETNYQYFFEDLGVDFKKVETGGEFLTAASELPQIQNTLMNCEQIPFEKAALCFDEHFFDCLDKYCRINLENYYCASKDRLTKKIIKKLPRVLSLLKSDVPRTKNSLVPIHGDYNPSNILIDKSGRGRLKVVDWEWMGLGLKHADLASLLKPVSSAIEREAIKCFAQNDKTLSIIEHVRFYNLAKVERGLFDAAFFAKHYLTAKTESSIDIPYKIKGALERALNGYSKIN